jgi:hypothetical protein
MGITVIGGLVTSTLLTLVVVPVFYTFFDDLPGAVRRLARLFRRPAVPADATSALEAGREPVGMR